MNVVKPLPHLTLLRLQKAKVNTPNNSFVFHFPSISFSTTPPLLWPGLSLWQVPPFPLSQAFLILASCILRLHLGPACHCGRSRLVTPTPPPFSTLTFSTLRPVSALPLPPPRPSFLSSHHGPARHCGRSRHPFLHSLALIHQHFLPFLLPFLTSHYPYCRSASLPFLQPTPLPIYDSSFFRPGLSLWRVPLSHYHSHHFLSFLNLGPAYHCGRSCPPAREP